MATTEQDVTAPPLVCGPAEFDEMEQILRGADGGLDEALTRHDHRGVHTAGLPTGGHP